MCEIILCAVLVFSNGPDVDSTVVYYPAQFVEDGKKIRYWETYGIAYDHKWRALSSTGDYCELQINRRWHEHRLTRRGLHWYSIYDPQTCWEIAFEIWQSSGGSFRQWSTKAKAGVQ